ncbi:MAG: LamG domain-containing protein, partial [Opitutaceae bacterium]|nr:LamG domain-containing protein [Opitutaceae bacterium]
KLSSSPIITDGKFDSQNIAFWDAAKKRYVAYYRDYFKGGDGKGIRAIKVAESADFKKWGEGKLLDYQSGAPGEDLYTSAIIPYSRAAGVYAGFPKRLVLDRGKPWDASGVPPAVSDGLFMTSRDGRKFYRWPEAFVRPGLQRERWINRNNMTAWGIVETAGEFPGAPSELSLYSTENYYSGSPARLRRLTVRLDGFVSARAGAAGGTVTTKPLTFSKPASFSPATGSALQIGIVRTGALFGAGALKVLEPLALPLPGTASLGKSVTLAAAFTDMRPGLRRLFSAYVGGANDKGARQLLFDFRAGAAGLSLRFWYDGAQVTAPAGAIKNWKGKTHLAATYDDGEIILYANGAEVARGGEKGAGKLRPAGGDIRFGEDCPPANMTNEPFLGLADDITVINRVLTPDEIKTAAGAGMASVIKSGDKGVFLDMEDGTGVAPSNRLAAGAPRLALPASKRWGGTMLLLNVSTSAAGGVRCEIRDAASRPVPGFTLADCEPFFGDEIEAPVVWKNGADVSSLAGRPVVLHFELKDADLHAYRFGQPDDVK